MLYAYSGQEKKNRLNPELGHCSQSSCKIKKKKPLFIFNAQHNEQFSSKNIVVKITLDRDEIM